MSIKKFIEGHISRISGEDLDQEKIAKANRRLKASKQAPDNIIQFPIKPNAENIKEAIDTFQENLRILEECSQEEKANIKNKLLKEIKSYLEILDSDEFSKETNKLASIKSYIEEKY